MSTQWEYRFYEPRTETVHGSRYVHWDVDEINKLGADGWEAVAVITEAHDVRGSAVLFKRKTRFVISSDTGPK